MRRLVSDAKSPGIFDASSGAPSPTAKPLLESALWNAPIHELTTVAVGQYSPGGAGGPNSTTGYEGGPVANPWDYVLMLEGAATFACAATRRHQSNTIARASFPFTVGAVGAGWGGIEATDESDARAEFWAPLWSRPARFCEIEALFGEGRAVTNGQTGPRRTGIRPRAGHSRGQPGFLGVSALRFLQTRRQEPLRHRHRAPPSGTVSGCGARS